MSINLVAIKVTMARKCFNVPELAKVSGIKECTIRRMFRGMTEPRLSTIGKLANALGVDVTEIVVMKEG